MSIQRGKWVELQTAASKKFLLRVDDVTGVVETSDRTCKVYFRGGPEDGREILETYDMFTELLAGPAPSS